MKGKEATNVTKGSDQLSPKELLLILASGLTSCHVNYVLRHDVIGKGYRIILPEFQYSTLASETT